MPRTDSLPVDIGDPADVRAKLPRAQEILHDKEERHRLEAKDVEAWRARVALFEQIASSQGEEPDPHVPTPEEEVAEAERSGAIRSSANGISIDFTGVETVLEAAVRTIDEQNRPIRSREVAELLRASGKFEGLTNETVSNALYYASERADPRRVRKLTKRGFYAPLLPAPPADVPGSVPDAVQQFVSRSIAVADSDRPETP